MKNYVCSWFWILMQKTMMKGNVCIWKNVFSKRGEGLRWTPLRQTGCDTCLPWILPISIFAKATVKGQKGLVYWFCVVDWAECKPWLEMCSLLSSLPFQPPTSPRSVFNLIWGTLWIRLQKVLKHLMKINSTALVHSWSRTKEAGSACGASPFYISRN